MATELPVSVTTDVVSVPPDIGIMGDFLICLTIRHPVDGNIDSDDTGSNATARSKGTRSYDNMRALLKIFCMILRFAHVMAYIIWTD